MRISWNFPPLKNVTINLFLSPHVVNILVNTSCQFLTERNQAIQEILTFEYFYCIWVLAGHNRVLLLFTDVLLFFLYLDCNLFFFFFCSYTYFRAQLYETFAWNHFKRVSSNWVRCVCVCVCMYTYICKYLHMQILKITINQIIYSPWEVRIATGSGISQKH